jgi:hypothetical protein
MSTAKTKAGKAGRVEAALVPRPPPPAGALDAFVTGAKAEPPPEAPPTPAPVRRGAVTVELPLPPDALKPRGRVKRAGGREAARVTIYLPLDVADRLRAYAASSGREISELVGPAICAVVDRLPDRR